MARPLLFIMCGPPFSGKSTLARAIEARFGITRIEVDAVHLERNLADVREADWRIAVQRSYRRLIETLSSGDSAIWDTANLTRAERDRMRRTSARLGANTLLIFVDTDDAERRKRRMANLVSGDRVDVPEPAFENAREAFEPPADDEYPIRFLSDESIDEWLTEIIAPLIAANEMEH